MSAQEREAPMKHPPSVDILMICSRTRRAIALSSLMRDCSILFCAGVMQGRSQAICLYSEDDTVVSSWAWSLYQFTPAYRSLIFPIAGLAFSRASMSPRENGGPVG